MLVALLLLGSAGVRAQTPLSNLVFTVGTTIHSGAQDWSFLLIGSENPSLLAGKRFAIYAKSGTPNNAGTYSLRATITQQTDAGAITSLLNQSVVLGENLTSLSNALNVALHNVAGATNLPLAQQTLTALNLANADYSMLQTVSLLSHNNPGLSLCLGQAFSEVISGVTTYEVREVSAASGVAGDVLGRVTITPGSPVILPAPGFPFQVSSSTALDDLRIRLRWGTPPELRRVALLSYGFNVWRMPAAIAVQMGFSNAPPTLSQLYSNAVLANDSPAMATKDFTTLSGSGGADDPADTTTYFYADDNGRKFGMPAFNDGDKFYYFVTARDLLGRDGLVSPGTPATACRKIPPSAPTNLRVQNALQTATIGGLQTNIQQLVLSWSQNTNAADNVTAYWVYRWNNPAQALTNDLVPLTNRIAVVAGIAGTNANSYLDNGTNAPLTPGVTNFWYTIRAVSQSACGPLLSQQSAPMWGVLREYTAPDPPTGEVLGSCGTPVVMFQNYNLITNATGTNTNTWSFRFTCQRRDRGIAWVQFTATGDTASATLGPIYFPPGGDTVSADFSEPMGTNVNPLVTVACQVGNYYGAASGNAYGSFSTAVASNIQSEAVFNAGQLLLTALSSSDPLLNFLNSSVPNCSSPSNVKLYPDGTVSLQFADSISYPGPRQVQVSSNSAWLDVGIAWPDTNMVYWISYPACLLGPMPAFRACVVNLPDNGLCDQHIARAADSGAVAPIHIRFRVTARTREYRLYRRINSGPLTLVSQGTAVYDATNPSRTMIVTDDAMPPGAVQMCYYAQTLDEHGNGSPLAVLGCKSVKPPVLPTPVLAEPAALGDTNNPQVLLNWFCPTAGVHRFQVQIERADQPASGKSTGFFGNNLLRVPNFNTTKYYAGLYALRTLIAHFDEGYLTQPIGVNFGPGPQFNITASVVAGVPYNISVGSVGDLDETHVFSQVWQFTWQPTNAIPNVPWPARPLPPVTQFDETNSANPRVAAVIMRYDTGNAQTYLDTRYPVGIRIGSLSNYTLLYKGGLSLNVGNTNFFYGPSHRRPDRESRRPGVPHRDRAGPRDRRRERGDRCDVVRRG
jgi:hypothetical protein